MLAVKMIPRIVVWVSCLLLGVIVAAAAATGGDVISSYIVHVKSAHAPRSATGRGLHATRAYAGFLRDNLPDHLLRPKPRVHYSYEHAATGFAARLTRRQAAHLESLPSVLAVVPDGEQQLYTTRSTRFLGLSTLAGLLAQANGAPDVVIGIIDSGIYPKDRAFFDGKDRYFPDHPPPPPSTFRGRCVSTPTFDGAAYCNKKLVGAKFFHKGHEAKLGRLMEETEKSPLDVNGHGTHVASIAAGSFVKGASFFHYGKGEARGVAPGARIAAYKACWTDACQDSAVLAAFEEAIADGAHVISVSFGAGNGTRAPEFHNDTLALASFRAVRKGIIVSAAAGNEGPGKSTVKNIAPWLMTVGASTVKRHYPAALILGNGKRFTGSAIYVGQPLSQSQIPLVNGRDCGWNLNKRKVTGKIVLCEPRGWMEHDAQAEAVWLAGGAGAILPSLQEEGYLTDPILHRIPAISISFSDYLRTDMYIKTSEFDDASATATIKFQGTVINTDPPPPRVASFSSRGPSPHPPEILKPDVTAPGVSILAAWTGEVPPIYSDTRRTEFNILSGTSMACPHVSGLAALLRQLQPRWSPAAVKSALMTTAYNMDFSGQVIKDMATGKASTPFVRGAGHVQPNAAMEPGLVYDADAEDYISFLCGLGYTAEKIALFTKDGSVTDCSKRKISPGDLNYPAFTVVVDPEGNKVTQRRVVTNAGSNSEATYKVSVTRPVGMRVTVNPPELHFTKYQRRIKYEVTFEEIADEDVPSAYTFGSITWSDGMGHKVTSPISVIWVTDELATM